MPLLLGSSPEMQRMHRRLGAPEDKLGVWWGRHAGRGCSHLGTEGGQVSDPPVPLQKGSGRPPWMLPICLPSAMASAPKWNHPRPNMGTAVATASFSHTCPAQGPPLVSRNSSPHQLHLLAAWPPLATVTLSHSGQAGPTRPRQVPLGPGRSSSPRLCRGRPDSRPG